MSTKAVLSAAFLWIFTSCATAAPNYPIAKIADTSTPIPNGVGNFVSFTEPTIAGPALTGPDGNSYKTYFTANGAGNFQGIYYGSGVGTLSPLLSRVADTTMAIPSLTGNYSSFSLVIGGYGTGASVSSRVAFSATSSVNANEKAIYVSTQGGAPTLVVGSGNVNGHTATTLGDASATANFFSFRADGAIYGNTSTLIADTTTQVPGASLGDHFAVLGTPRVFEDFFTNRLIAFRGASNGGVKGVYIHQTTPSNNTAFSKIADTNTQVPGGVSNFTDFGDITGNANTAFFRGISATKQGIYRCFTPYSSPTLFTMADSGAIAPDAAGATFSSFGDPSANSISTGVAWTATLSDGREGIYATLATGTGLLKIIDTKDLLDGKSIADLSISPVAFTSSRTIVFKAVFTDGSSGIYDAVLVPEPATMLLASCLPLLIRRKR